MQTCCVIPVSSVILPLFSVLTLPDLVAGFAKSDTESQNHRIAQVGKDHLFQCLTTLYIKKVFLDIQPKPPSVHREAKFMEHQKQVLSDQAV